MSRILLLWLFLLAIGANSLKAQPDKYEIRLSFKLYDENGKPVTSESPFIVKPLFREKDKRDYQDSFYNNLSYSRQNIYQYTILRYYGRDYSSSIFRILIIHAADSMIIDPDVNSGFNNISFDSIPFIKGQFFVPREWQISLNEDKLFTGGNFYPMKWEDFEITKPKPRTILYEKIYNPTYYYLFFSPKPEYIKQGLYAVSEGKNKYVSIYKKSHPVDSIVMKTGLPGDFFARPTRFYQQYNQTFIYMEEASFLYYSNDTDLKNWKMAYFEGSPNTSGKYKDYLFQIKQVSQSTSEHHLIVLGAITFTYNEEFYNIPAWYRVYFDVEPGSDRYIELQKKVDKQIREHLGIKSPDK
jgi:hypothetical protein